MGNLENCFIDMSEGVFSLGVSTLFKPRNPHKAIKEILAAGINTDTVEIAIADQIPFGEARKIKNLGKEKNIDFSVHAPFLFDDIAYPHDEIRKIFVNEVKKSIDFAEQIGAKMVNTHPGKKSIRPPEVDVFSELPYQKDLYLKNSMESLAEIKNYAESKNIIMAVENTSEGVGKSPRNINTLISKTEGVIFNLDIGHSNITRNTEEFLELPISHMHLHDNDGVEDRHRPPGEGNINFKELKENLLNKGYKGKIILELYSIAEILKGLEYLASKCWL